MELKTDICNVNSLRNLIKEALAQCSANELRVYDNHKLMELLCIKDKYLKKLRDDGYISYSRKGDKYWYTQKDVEDFLKRCHYDSFATNPNIPLNIDCK